MKKIIKKFDLELAKAGHPVQTRDGRPARIICYDRKGNKPIVALIYEKEDNVEHHHFYFNDGLFLTSTKKSPEDLVMATTKKGGWINIYTDNATNGCIYNTKEEALEDTKCESGFDYITTIKIEWEE